jgi:hypothetical protein
MSSGPVHLLYGLVLAAMAHPESPEYGGVILYSSLAPDFATAAYHDRYPDLRYVDYRWAHWPEHVHEYAEIIADRTVTPLLRLDRERTIWCAEVGISSHLFLDVYTHVRTSPIKEWRERWCIQTVLRDFYRPWDRHVEPFARWALGNAVAILGGEERFWRYVERACEVVELLMGDYVRGAYLRNLSEKYFGDPNLHLVDWIRWFWDRYGYEENPPVDLTIQDVTITADPEELLAWMAQFDPQVMIAEPGGPGGEGGQGEEGEGSTGTGSGGSPLPLIPVIPPLRRR